MYKKTSTNLQHANEVDAPGKTGGYARGTLSLKDNPSVVIPKELPKVYGGIWENKITWSIDKDTYLIQPIIKAPDEGFRKLFDRHQIDLHRPDKSLHLMSFRFSTPADYQITQENVFDYLEYMVFCFGQKSQASERVITFRESNSDTSLSIMRAVGVRHFTIETPKEKFSFTVDGESRVFAQHGWPLSGHHLIIFNNFAVQRTYQQLLRIAPEGLYLNQYNKDVPAQKEEGYFIPFKTVIKDQDLSYSNLSRMTIPVEPSLFEDPDVYKSSYKETQLVWKNIGEFFYLEAVDTSVWIIPYRQASLYLLKTITKMIQSQDDLLKSFHNTIGNIDLQDDPKMNEINYVRSLLLFYNSVWKKLS